MASRSTRVAITIATLSLLIPLTQIAQGKRDSVPLKHWPSPLYWQPTRAESDAATTKADAFSTLKGDLSASATTPLGALVFVAMTPCRVADTRDGVLPTGFGPPSLSGGATRTFAIQLPSSPCPVPPVAQAYSFNITVVPPGATFPGNVNPSGAWSYLTVWPTGVPQPVASTLSSFLGTVVANAAVVPAGTSGSVDVFVSHSTDFILDINGYYAPQSSVTLAQGSAGAPTLSFAGDPGTGIFSSGNGTLDIATRGSSRLAVRSDGDIDLSGNIRKGGIPFLHDLGLYSIGVGHGALQSNVGSSNTAIGENALTDNTTGYGNTASGYGALEENTTGIFNSAAGFYALYYNTTGYSNTATGENALASNTEGFSNTATGGWTLTFNTTGNYNTAGGFKALINATGDRNIALGSFAGFNITDTSNNIHIGSTGVSGDANTIRIGAGPTDVQVPAHSRSFLAAVRGVTTGAADAVNVVIDSNGQLGTINSSRRFKQDIQDMANASDRLMQLRPVTFRYIKPYENGSKPIDYGLIAEEVERVFPNLVVKGADGQLETVQYQKLTPMLLNELQKQHERMRQQEDTIRNQQEQNRKLEERLARLEALLAAEPRQ